MSKDKKWIQNSVPEKNKGKLHKALGVPLDKKIPAKKLEKATHSKNPKVKKQAILAETLKGFRKKK